MNRDDALRTLGLGPEATLDEARCAYREQVKLWHPDRYSDNSALKSLALKNAQDANLAWAFLRTRLPRSAPGPITKAARSAKRKRDAPPPSHAAGSTRQTTLNRILHRCACWAAPLVGRIRQIQIAGLAAWLRDDPNRHYRPWYRYSRKSADHSAQNRSRTFGQTLAQAMKKRGSAARPPGPNPRRGEARSIASPPGVGRRKEPDVGIGAVPPVERSRKA